MSISYQVAALSGDQAPLAFPLIQATWRDADLVAWRNYVEFFNDEGIVGQKAGVLAMRDGSGAICGVLTYRVGRNLMAGAILGVNLFTAVDLANSPETVRALLDAAEVRAVELGCAEIEVRLSSEQRSLTARLRALGLAPESGLLSKRLGRPQTRN